MSSFTVAVGIVVLGIAASVQSGLLDLPPWLDFRACPVRGSDITGAYNCGGQCFLASGEIITVQGETDVIRHLEGDLYHVTIDNEAAKFHEEEVGALSATGLRTSTWKVSDSKFPVLEEYEFVIKRIHLDSASNWGKCAATSFQKTVRNPTDPTDKQFKSCSIHCLKQK